MPIRPANRDPVLQDQKVLPEIRNRQLLLRVFSVIQSTEISLEIPFELSPYGITYLLAYVIKYVMKYTTVGGVQGFDGTKKEAPKAVVKAIE